MKVGWLADDPGYVGGAERTQAEFRSAAPDGVEVISCPAAHVTQHLDRYVVHNCMSYPADTAFYGPFVRYHHDVVESSLDALLAKHEHVQHIYCSPLQREKMGGYGPVIPPALDLDRFRITNGERKGAVWLGMHPNHPGKGLDLAKEWANGNGGLDVWDDIPHEKVPELLARYETFVHLPRAIEPFGRSVVEAWASGCEVVINANVGARYWIEQNPRGLETASETFWDVVLG